MDNLGRQCLSLRYETIYPHDCGAPGLAFAVLGPELAGAYRTHPEQFKTIGCQFVHNNTIGFVRFNLTKTMGCSRRDSFYEDPIFTPYIRNRARLVLITEMLKCINIDVAKLIRYFNAIETTYEESDLIKSICTLMANADIDTIKTMCHKCKCLKSEVYWNGIGDNTPIEILKRRFGEEVIKSVRRT